MTGTIQSVRGEQRFVVEAIQRDKRWLFEGYTWDASLANLLREAEGDQRMVTLRTQETRYGYLIVGIEVTA